MRLRATCLWGLRASGGDTQCWHHSLGRADGDRLPLQPGALVFLGRGVGGGLHKGCYGGPSRDTLRAISARAAASRVEDDPGRDHERSLRVQFFAGRADALGEEKGARGRRHEAPVVPWEEGGARWTSVRSLGGRRAGEAQT